MALDKCETILNGLFWNLASLCCDFGFGGRRGGNSPLGIRKLEKTSAKCSQKIMEYKFNNKNLNMMDKQTKYFEKNIFLKIT